MPEARFIILMRLSRELTRTYVNLRDEFTRIYETMAMAHVHDHAYGPWPWATLWLWVMDPTICLAYVLKRPLYWGNPPIKWKNSHVRNRKRLLGRF